MEYNSIITPLLYTLSVRPWHKIYFSYASEETMQDDPVVASSEGFIDSFEKQISSPLTKSQSRQACKAAFILSDHT